MAGNSKIEWCTDTWNPIVGCSIVSPGCTNCYAMKMAGRIEAMATARTTAEGSPGTLATHYAGTTRRSKAGPVWTGKLALAPDHILLQPLTWKRPRMIFVNSMGDLFHEDVSDAWIDKVFAVMALCQRHDFLVLTKRSLHMCNYMRDLKASGRWLLWRRPDDGAEIFCPFSATFDSAFANVGVGVSAEDQQRYDERKEHLQATPATVRFFSMEPLLGPIQADYLGDWVIVGGESGPGARPMHPDWARSIRDQCQAAGVPFFFKQWGAWHADTLLFTDTAGRCPPPNMKIGKGRAGRLLDGQEHNAMPACFRREAA